MKKAFIQVRERIIKNRKKLIYGVLALFVGQICFFGLKGVGVDNVVFADDKGNTASESTDFQEKATERLKKTELLRNLCYVLTYPILILAGKLVDNSLVYGEAFGFDAVLWQLWVIVRNLANFALAFIFIWKIFEYLIKPDKNNDVKNLLLRTLIAGVGIQASRFFMAVLIDASTIMTYGVGGLPLSILKNEELKKDNPYVLTNVLSVDANEGGEFHRYLSNSKLNDKDGGCKNYISECETFATKGTEYIVGPQMVYYKGDKGYCPTESDRCHLGNNVYQFVHTLTWSSCSDEETCKGAQNVYKDSMNNFKKLLGEEQIVWDIKAWGTEGLDKDNEAIGKERSLPKLNDILSGNYAGVFSALYSSLMNSGDELTLKDTQKTSLYVSLLNTMLSFCHMLAIAVPLIAMCIVFLMRIGVLWMAIALSPFIVLLKAFDLEKMIDKKELLQYLTVGNLIGIIFSPVVICFAVSMSTVLVRIISTMNVDVIETGDPLSILGGVIKLDIAGMGVNIGKMVCSVLGVAITWFLVWAAVKSSKLGEKVEGLKGLAERAMGSATIIPVPGPDGKTHYMGVSTVFGGNGQEGIISQMSNQIKNKYTTESQTALEQWLDPDKAKKDAAQKLSDNRVTTYLSGLTSATTIDANWQTLPFPIKDIDGKDVQTTFNSLNEGEKQKVVEAINDMEDSKREKFSAVNKIDIGGGKVYKRDNNEKKYKEETSTTS